jgi:hypothetical protein
MNNNKNESLMNYTTVKIIEETTQILEVLKFDDVVFNIISEKLKGYRYVDELNIIVEGRYFRWINLTDPSNLMLNKGAVLCKVQIHDACVHLLFKTFFNRCFNIKLNEILLFMKLNEQELVLLSALDHLA